MIGWNCPACAYANVDLDPGGLLLCRKCRHSCALRLDGPKAGVLEHVPAIQGGAFALAAREVVSMGLFVEYLRNAGIKFLYGFVGMAATWFTGALENLGSVPLPDGDPVLAWLWPSIVVGAGTSLAATIKRLVAGFKPK